AERRQAVDRAPQRFLHLLRLGREELERDVDLARAEETAFSFVAWRCHDPIRSSFCGCLGVSAASGLRASQSETVSCWRSSCFSRARLLTSMPARPASLSQAVTWSASQPRR